MKLLLRLAFATLLTIAAIGHAQTTSSEWLTWGYDQERSGWNRGESTLSAENVSRLELKWKIRVSTVPNKTVLSTLTAPLVVGDVRTVQGSKNVVFIVGSDDVIFALDESSGRILWQKSFAGSISSDQPATWLCPNTQNSTPVIDKQNATIYLITSDGKLRALNISNGQERFPPIDFVTPFARTWSLNLIDHVIYTSVARGCGGAVSNIAAMDVTDPFHPRAAHFSTSTGRSSGAWGRGGIVKGPTAVYAQTADGLFVPSIGAFGQSVIALTFKTLQLSDSFAPENWQKLNRDDLDFGSASPVTFPFEGWTLLAAAGKESVVYLLSIPKAEGEHGAAEGNSETHLTPLYHSPHWGNDSGQFWGHGVWGAMATYRNPQSERWLYVPIWGPPSKDAPKFPYTNGPASAGSIMAFRVIVKDAKPVLLPVWRSRELQVPDPPVVANGVVFATQTGENTVQFPPDVRAKPVSNLQLHAFDARTGKELYSSGDALSGWVHFSEPVVADGHIFLTSWDSYVYCFGLKP
jgi:outer membrane protein assembly factor BamB